MYYCPKCKEIELDRAEDARLSCRECHGSLYALHIDDEQWEHYSPQKRRELLDGINSSVLYEKKISRTPNSTRKVVNAATGSYNDKPQGSKWKIAVIAVVAALLIVGAGIGAYAFISSGMLDSLMAGGTSDDYDEYYDDYEEWSEDDVYYDDSSEADESDNCDEWTDEDEWFEEDVNEYSNGFLTVRYLNVQQGDCTIIESDGHYMMIDGATANQSGNINKCIQNMGITHFDYIIATHPAPEHIGGIAGVLSNVTVGTFYSPFDKVSGNADFDNVLKYLNKQGVSVTVPDKKEELTLGSAGVTLYSPIKDISDIDNSSIVTKVTYGATSYLFMGDAHSKEEEALLAMNESLRSKVIELGSHGGSSTTSAEFIQKINPVYAVISSGDGSGNGIDEALLTKLSDYNIETFCVKDNNGEDIVAECDGDSIYWNADSYIDDSASDEVVYGDDADDTDSSYVRVNSETDEYIYEDDDTEYEEEADDYYIDAEEDNDNDWDDELGVEIEFEDEDIEVYL